MFFANLASHPEKINSYIGLIEKSFSYVAPYSFAIDFYPLIDSVNFKNCYMYLNEEGKIVATCAAQKRYIIAKNNLPVYFFGGIAVEKSLRGKGIGKKLILNCISCLEDHAWVGLWSEKKTFFNSLGFSDYGDQYFLPRQYLTLTSDKVSVKIFSIGNLHQGQWSHWKKSYEYLTKNYITLERLEKDWSNIAQISSAQYIELIMKNEVIGYAIANKGMDLQNVIHEFYVEKKFEELALSKLNQDYSLWLPIFDYDWNKEFLGPNLLIKPGKTELWNQWQWQSKEKKHLFISGLDSV